MRKLSGLLVVMVWALTLVFSTAARAHNLKFTGVKVQFNAKATLVSVVAHLQNFGSADPAMEIPRLLQLRIGGQPFISTQAQLIRDKVNGIVIWQTQASPVHAASASGVPEVEIEAPLFPDIAGESTVVTVIHDRQVFAESVVDASHPSAVLGARGQRMRPIEVVGRFIREGIGHIFGGIDHILFLLSLLLLGGSTKQLLKIVTAFTLAHSITLSLAATGVVTLAPRLVEPVIALSIVVVALSNLRRYGQDHNEKPLDLRPLMAFGFGLIHGFGFAGALAEVGLPREALGWALVSFNLGVEMGQATLVLLFAPTLALVAAKWPRLQRPILVGGSAGVALMGAIWFVQRLFVV